MRAGRVLELCIRPGRTAPQTAPAAQAIAGVGLAGDRHARATSPRQVLIASVQTYVQWQLPPLALRHNLLLDCAVDDLRSGDRLQVGADVELVVMFACEPCGRLNAQRAGLSAQIGRARGLLARVARGGSLGQGDAVRLTRAAAPLWSDDWRVRVKQVLRLVPPDQWVTFGRLAELAGVSPGCCRAFPRLLSALPEDLRQRALAAGAHAAGGGRGAPWDGSDLHAADVAVEGMDRP